MKDSTVYGLADEMPRWPVFYMAIIFFCLTPIPVDTAIRMIESNVMEEKEKVEEEKAIEY